MTTTDNTTTLARAPGTVPALVLRLRRAPTRDDVLTAANQIVEYREMLTKCEQYFAIRNLGQHADKLLADIRDCLKENTAVIIEMDTYKLDTGDSN